MLDSQGQTSMPSMSRYRSQRKQITQTHISDALQHTPPLPPPPPMPSDEQQGSSASENLQRSRSRYRANRPVIAPSKAAKSSFTPQYQSHPTQLKQETLEEEPQKQTSARVALQPSRSIQNLRAKPERYHQPHGQVPQKSKSAHDLKAKQIESQESNMQATRVVEKKGSNIRGPMKAEDGRLEAERQRQIALQHLAHNEKDLDHNRSPKLSSMSGQDHFLPSVPAYVPAHNKIPLKQAVPGEDPAFIFVEQQRMELERLEEAERIRWHRKREQQKLNSKRAELLKVQKVSDMKEQSRKDALQNRQRAEQAEYLRRQKFREMQREASERSDTLQKQQDARKARDEHTEKSKQAWTDNEAKEKEQQDRWIQYRQPKEEKNSCALPEVPRTKPEKVVETRAAEERMPYVPENHQVAHETQREDSSRVGNGEDFSISECSSKIRSRQESSTSGPRPSTSREMFGFLKKKRSEESQSLAGRMLGRSRTTSAPKKSADVRPSGGGIVPRIDAPVSAVNAGERRVTVECGRSRRVFPVTPTTTPVDLIRSASIVMSEEIDPKCSVLFEDFEKVGVRRPLRKYEHVRDVMNSWDEDSQNSLVLLPSTTDGNDLNLEAACVPVEQPGQLGMWLFYSNKPGKWEKRWVVMRQDGQVQHAKKEDSLSKDFSNICHLSDFDIYTPDPKSLTKKIRPPKKHCFAIKSQQKSNMFLTMDKFVHFFAAGDKDVATKWYDRIQGWRSWYLVHMLGEGTDANTDGSMVPERHNTSHQRNASNHSAYQLGSFQPLLDLDMFKLSPSDPQPTAKLTVKGSVSRSSSAKHQSQTSRGGIGTHPSHTNSLSPQRMQTLHKRGPSNAQSTLSGGSSGTDENMFASGGLLGRSYSARQKAQRERDVAAKMEDGFVYGSNLLNPLNIGSSRLPADQSGDCALTRNPSKRGSRHGPKPLIDLTSTADDGHTSAHKGKGYTPEQVGHGGLVESATTPETTVDWRSRPQEQDGRKSIDRSRSQHKRQMNSGGDSGNNALFLQDGLLATSRAGVGEGRPGRGIMDGSKATGPMLDMNQRSKFAMGSLLSKVERKLGPGSPMIDRTKQGEVVQTKTGEGL